MLIVVTLPKPIKVTASWCNDDCNATVTISTEAWERIAEGEKVTVETTYWKRRGKHPALFVFNAVGKGSLEVIDEDGFVSFDGQLSDVLIDGAMLPPEIG